MNRLTKTLLTIGLVCRLTGAADLWARNPPDIYIFEFDDTHYAPRLSSFCGFPISVREWGTLVDVIYYDRDGNYQGENLVLHSGGVSATNELTGETLSSRSAELFRYGLEGASVSGLGMVFRVPGGGPILLETGRFAVDFTSGEIVFEAGVHDYQDGDWQGLCNALGG